MERLHILLLHPTRGLESDDGVKDNNNKNNNNTHNKQQHHHPTNKINNKHYGRNFPNSISPKTPFSGTSLLNTVRHLSQSVSPVLFIMSEKNLREGGRIPRH